MSASLLASRVPAGSPGPISGGGGSANFGKRRGPRCNARIQRIVIVLRIAFGQLDVIVAGTPIVR
jgi:hypothetical protein